MQYHSVYSHNDTLLKDFHYAFDKKQVNFAIIKDFFVVLQRKKNRAVFFLFGGLFF